MGRSKPVVLSNRTFGSQKAAKEHFSAMLHRYAPGERVCEDDAAELAELLKRHPSAASKIGVGIDHFEVQEADYESQCFRAVRTDGTWEKFSYHPCVAPDQKWD